MNSFNPLTAPPPFDINNYFLQLDLLEVFHLLKALNPGKASGPDDIPNNWFLKDCAEILAQPICEILTAVMLKGGATGSCGGKGWNTPHSSANRQMATSVRKTD
jgi:hypothetical protein